MNRVLCFKFLTFLFTLFFQSNLNHFHRSEVHCHDAQKIPTINGDINDLKSIQYVVEQEIERVIDNRISRMETLIHDLFREIKSLNGKIEPMLIKLGKDQSCECNDSSAILKRNHLVKRKQKRFRNKIKKRKLRRKHGRRNQQDGHLNDDHEHGEDARAMSSSIEGTGAGQSPSSGAGKSTNTIKDHNSSHNLRNSEAVVIAKRKKTKNEISGQILLVIGGKSHEQLGSSEVLRFGKMNKECQKQHASSSSWMEVPNLPKHMTGSVGTFINGKALVCGGRQDLETYFNQCYALDVKGHHERKKELARNRTSTSKPDDMEHMARWEEYNDMMNSRYQATALKLEDDVWWVTGGFDGKQILNSTEILDTTSGKNNGDHEEKFKTGPDLPKPTFHHCLVKINDTHIFLTGGYPHNRNAWVLDFPRRTWTPLSDAYHIRDEPHCAKIVDEKSGEIEILVVGGSLPISSTTSEIFSFRTEKWRPGPKLDNSIPIHATSTETFDGTLMILGGEERSRKTGGDDGTGVKSILYYERSSKNSEKWSVHEKSMKHARSQFVTINVPLQSPYCNLRTMKKKKIWDI